MRAILFSIFLLLPMTSSNAQIVVEASRMKGIYRGAAMGFSIVVDSFGCENIVVKAHNGIIEPETKGLHNCRYRFTPGKIGEAIIEVFVVDGVDTQKVAERTYNVRSWPMPVARLCHPTESETSDQDLKDCKYLHAYIPGIDESVEPRIRSFHVTLLRKGEPVAHSLNRGAGFQPETQALLSKAQKGDFILFEDIKAALPLEPAERKLNSITWRYR